MKTLQWLHARRDSIVAAICAAGLVLFIAYAAVYDDSPNWVISLAEVAK